MRSAVMIFLVVAIAAVSCVNKLNRMKEAVQSTGDPMSDLKAVTEKINKINEDCEYLSITCFVAKRRALIEYYDQADKYVPKVTSRGNPEELLWILDTYGDKYSNIVIPKIIEIAEVIDNPSLRVLFIAGRELDRGVLVPRNTELAIKYLFEAWKLGSKGAPQYLTKAFRTVGDNESVYLWALRCVNECYPSIDLSEAEKSVPAERRIEIQKIATTKQLDVNPRRVHNNCSE